MKLYEVERILKNELCLRQVIVENESWTEGEPVGLTPKKHGLPKLRFGFGDLHDPLMEKLKGSYREPSWVHLPGTAWLAITKDQTNRHECYFDKTIKPKYRIDRKPVQGHWFSSVFAVVYAAYLQTPEVAVVATKIGQQKANRWAHNKAIKHTKLIAGLCLQRFFQSKDISNIHRALWNMRPEWRKEMIWRLFEQPAENRYGLLNKAAKEPVSIMRPELAALLTPLGRRTYLPLEWVIFPADDPREEPKSLALIAETWNAIVKRHSSFFEQTPTSYLKWIWANSYYLGLTPPYPMERKGIRWQTPFVNGEYSTEANAQMAHDLWGWLASNYLPLIQKIRSSYHRQVSELKKKEREQGSDPRASLQAKANRESLQRLAKGGLFHPSHPKKSKDVMAHEGLGWKAQYLRDSFDQWETLTRTKEWREVTPWRVLHNTQGDRTREEVLSSKILEALEKRKLALIREVCGEIPSFPYSKGLRATQEWADTIHRLHLLWNGSPENGSYSEAFEALKASDSSVEGLVRNRIAKLYSQWAEPVYNRILPSEGTLLFTSEGKKVRVSFKRLTPQELVNEGQEMGHCVGSYQEKVKEHSSAIFHLVEKDTEEKSTLEILIPSACPTSSSYRWRSQGDVWARIEINQNRGKFNRTPSSALVEAGEVLCELIKEAIPIPREEFFEDLAYYRRFLLEASEEANDNPGVFLASLTKEEYQFPILIAEFLGEEKAKELALSLQTNQATD